MVSGEDKSRIVAAVGNFDGVHRGHQYLLDQTAAFARDCGARPGVVVFDPHPRRYFRPDDPPFLLTSPAQRDALLREYGAVEIIALPFDKALASLSPEAFVKDILKAQLGLAGVITGADFRFGSERAGDGDALKAFGREAGLEVRLAEVISDNPDTDKFGSSAIRAALTAGDVKGAAQMLGRRWAVRGKIIEGQKLGRSLGFPTANMTLGDLTAPRPGVYAVQVLVDGDKAGDRYKGVANFGRRPTVKAGAGALLLETNLFDFSGDLYGKVLEIVFVDFIRDERKFDGLDALKAQIGADCEAARAILA